MNLLQVATQSSREVAHHVSSYLTANFNRSAPISSLRHLSTAAEQSHIVSFLLFLYTWIVELPLWFLYVNGPSIGGWFFWEGRNSYDICASLTVMPSDFWKGPNALACETLVYNHFRTYMTLLICVVYFFTLISICRCLWRRYMAPKYTQQTIATDTTHSNPRPSTRVDDTPHPGCTQSHPVERGGTTGQQTTGHSVETLP